MNAAALCRITNQVYYFLWSEQKTVLLAPQDSEKISSRILQIIALVIKVAPQTMKTTPPMVRWLQ